MNVAKSSRYHRFEGIWRDHGVLGAVDYLERETLGKPDGYTTICDADVFAIHLIVQTFPSKNGAYVRRNTGNNRGRGLMSSASAIAFREKMHGALLPLIKLANYRTPVISHGHWSMLLLIETPRMIRRAGSPDKVPNVDSDACDLAVRDAMQPDKKGFPGLVDNDGRITWMFSHSRLSYDKERHIRVLVWKNYE